jgi:hypothetical protein
VEEAYLRRSPIAIESCSPMIGNHQVRDREHLIERRLMIGFLCRERISLVESCLLKVSVSFFLHRVVQACNIPGAITMTILQIPQSVLDCEVLRGVFHN